MAEMFLPPEMDEDKRKKAAAALSAVQTGNPQQKPVYTNTKTTEAAPQRHIGVNRTNPEAVKALQSMGGGVSKQVAPARRMGGSGRMAASNRMDQVKSLVPKEGPELISYETNPNMDWRQAAAINQERTRGFNAEKTAGINALGSMGRADITGEHGLDQVQQRGVNQLATTNQIGQNRLAQIGARGAETRKTQGLTLSMGHQNTMEEGAQQNIYDKEKIHMQGALGLAEKGVPGDKVNSLYQTPGDFPGSLAGVQVPQKQAESGIGFMKISGGVDKKGNKLSDRIMRTNDRSGEVSPTALAPQSALEMLQQDPDAYLDSFVEKYGYLPDGYGQ